ncbi:hypothetical protein SZN_16290 [Streptomyces zinciresistens K42]|uniref:Uncharacterized protein n=1 Tax=Streptomyces zinciresistens K42 TaxID=700597 RepID=G2GCN3_9ACTN|nr:hypothetical protein SZN_16290 [Streptomyces zinciresistens K42]
MPVATYCRSPGCDGATRAAPALAEPGCRVEEMLGGFAYGVREGCATETGQGLANRPPTRSRHRPACTTATAERAVECGGRVKEGGV